jgi:hypothetical protein
MELKIRMQHALNPITLSSLRVFAVRAKKLTPMKKSIISRTKHEQVIMKYVNNNLYSASKNF